MSETYEINVVPASRREIETLHDLQSEFDSVRGDERAAVFGQLWVDGRVGKLKAHVFSGKAANYLNKHILKAIKMQNAAVEDRHDD